MFDECLVHACSEVTSLEKLSLRWVFYRLSDKNGELNANQIMVFVLQNVLPNSF